MLKFLERSEASPNGELAGFLSGYSIEVMPRTAAKIEDFRSLLPAGTRVYIAHIEGTPIDDMVATAARLSDDGFEVMPHIPARSIDSAATLQEWVSRYRDAGADQALLLAGGNSEPCGEFASSIEMMDSGIFEKYGFRRLHVAGHPEGNRDIEPDGTTALIDEALLWKQQFAERTGIEMVITTQFVFDARPVIEWAGRIRELGVRLPIHVGMAGPAKLQTLIKYAVACGVGPSVKVIKKRAADLTKLMTPFEPTDVAEALAKHKAQHPDSLIEKAHFFPLGGVRASAEWANRQTGALTTA